MEKQIRSKLFLSPEKLFPEVPPIKTPDIQGWASTSETFKEVLLEHKPRLVIEIGTWKGASAIYMASLLTEIHGDRNFEIVCIDTFLGSVEHWNRTSYLMTLNYGRPNLYDVFISNLLYTSTQDVITPFPVDSKNGLLTLKHFSVIADLIYIDAGHDYDSVYDDISHSIPILKQDGILLGDDIHHPPIVAACNDLLPNWKQNRDKFIWQKK